MKSDNDIHKNNQVDNEIHERTIRELLRQVSERNRISSLLKDEKEKLAQQISEDNNILKSFDAKVAGLDIVIKQAQKAVLDRDNQITALNGQLQEESNQAQAMGQAIVERDCQVTMLTGKLQEVSNRVRATEQAIDERDSQVTALTNQLQEASNRSRATEQAIDERESQVTALTNQLHEEKGRSETLEQAIEERDRKLAAKDQQFQERGLRIEELEIRIAQMQSSIAWQLLTRYHNCFVETALPQGTKPRRLYDLGLKGGRILINEGWGSFYRSAKEYRRVRCLPKLCSSELVNLSMPEEKPELHEDLFVCKHLVSTAFTPLEAQIDLKKGYNLIRFHVPEGCERPCDILELKTGDARYLSLGAKSVEILNGTSKLPINFVNNWHGAEDRNGESFRWMTNDVTVLVATDYDCQANLRLQVLSFNRPRTIEIYVNTLVNKSKMVKNDNKKFIRMKEVGPQVNEDAVKNKLKEIVEKLHEDL